MPECTINSDILLNSILENCLDIITIKDLNGNYIACNKAFLNLVNISSDEDVIGKHILDVLTYDSKDFIFEQFKSVLKTGEACSGTFVLKDKHINKIINQTSTPILKNGCIVRVLSVSRDVTHEENLKHKLIDKICQLNTLLEHLPMPVYLRDTEFKYKTGSKYAKDFVEKGVDRYCGDVQLDMDYTAELVSQEDRYILDTKKALQVERKTMSIDGLEQWYEIYKAPILGEDRNVSSILTIAKNINSEKFLETQKELFLSTLTHDLKNPVQAQMMSLKLLSDGVFGELKPEQQEILDMLMESTAYMQKMIKSILTTYKFDNGQITLNKEIFEVEELVQSCVNEVLAFAQSKNVNIICDFDIKDTMLLGDIQQLRRVISNLMNNALNYSYDNSDIRITVVNNGQSMVFSFENFSPVIPEHIKVNIFDKYVTGAKSFKHTGIGLGLYFCKKVVDAHNGRIYLDAVGEYNKFVFEIPLKDENINASISW